MYSPSLDEFVRRASEGNLIPVYRDVLADLETPVSAFLKVGGGPHSFLLESVSGGEQISRYSFISGSPFLVLKTRGRQVEMERDGRVERSEIPEGQDPLDVLRELMSAHRFVKDPDLPPFCGGAVGYIGYDTVRFFERLPDLKPDDRGLPDCYFVFTDTLLIFDHVSHRIKVLCLARVDGSPEYAYEAALKKIDRLIAQLRESLPYPSTIDDLGDEDEAPPDEDARLWIHEAEKVPPLDRDREAALIASLADPEQAIQARRVLVASNLRLVVPLARSYAGRGVGFARLLQLGQRGLETAAATYEPASVERFSSHAIRAVRRALNAALAERDTSDLRVRSIPSRPEHEAAVLRAKEYIAAGDVIQVVLSRRMQVDVQCSPFQIYRALRSVNPSPYMFFLQFHDCQLIGASPETLVTERGGHVVTRPIAGTIRRGRNAEEDAVLEAQLLADPKEKAEHIMLVDLHRNDIGRVCLYGSVQVDQLMVTEKYSHVIHIVSNVVGKLRPDRDAYDLIRAAFPAGTLSGAPKIRAMEIIEELESVKRGPYGGVIGYFSFDGDMDTAITLRTIVMQGQTAYVQAGGGIVADSDPAAEFTETENKAGALLRAIELAERGLQ